MFLLDPLMRHVEFLEAQLDELEGRISEHMNRADSSQPSSDLDRDERRPDPERIKRHCVRRLKDIGYCVQLKPIQEPA